MGRWLSSAKRALLKVTLAPPKSTLEQRSAKRLLQKSCGFENQRVTPHLRKGLHLESGGGGSLESN